jgi:uncharacterized membrane protein YfcA
MGRCNEEIGNLIPHLQSWQWSLGVFSAIAIGIAKTGMPGLSTFVAPLMILTVGDARYAAAWTLPTLSTADVFAVLYWRRHADARKLFSLIPAVVVGMIAGALALNLDEHVLRRLVGSVVVLMLIIQLARKRNRDGHVPGSASFYGIIAGFASTIANAAAPVMNMYLLSRKLTKEQFVATGAWFFLVINLAKVPIYSWHHLFSPSSLTFNLMMVPAVIGGAILGLWVVHRVPQRLFDTLIIVLTAISAIVLFR